ncbi:M56 family metallopeptidase [Paenibacillus dokdonensis]|uniref:M56 family metallopeptidase n=1 Tax=Paenibacillus dokdonensis TaxID=2567944 RepID=UPI0010A78755|nr:M56 family metallopeptidase [Paenibacillus dokdonensis]
MHIAESLFRWFVASTLTASLAAIVVIVVQHLLRRRISARLRYTLWLIVMVRLVLPVFPHSPVSLFNALPNIIDIKKAVSELPFQQDRPAGESENSAKEISLQPYYTSNEAGRNNPKQVIMVQDPHERAVSMETGTHPAIRILSIVWLAGTVAFLTYHLIYWLRMKGMQRSFSRVYDPAMMKVAEECRNLFSVKRFVSMYTHASVRSPYMTGILRPAVYLPDTFCRETVDAAPLKHVIAHELAHYKRKDTAWNMLGSVVLAFHWMNPLVWLMMRRMKADRELACDACVLEVLGEEEAVPYGMTIIGFLKRYSSRRNQPHLLYFKGMNGEKDIMRRIRMIKSFKKGSYKFSLLAVLLVLLISAATLTNAPVSSAGTSAWIHAEDGGNELLFSDMTFREYDNLDKASRVAPFQFKVPAVLPEGMAMDNISYHLQPLTSSASPEISVWYSKAKANTIYGSMELTIVRGAGLQEWYEQTVKEEEELGDAEAGGKVIQKSPISIAGLEGLKMTIRMTAWKEHPERYTYLWKDQGVTYRIHANAADISSSDFEHMVASMRYPDEALNKLYENNEYTSKMINYVYDTEDIRRAQKLIGYNAAFPRKLPGDFTASLSYVSRKGNFNFSENDTDSMRKLLSVAYSPLTDVKSVDSHQAGIKSVQFMQMLNGDMYEDMKKSGTVSFSRIDGKRFIVKLQQVIIHGHEVLRTEKFKIDGELSNPGETDRISYFWLDENVCFQARFAGQGPEEQAIVQYLMEQDK